MTELCSLEFEQVPQRITGSLLMQIVIWSHCISMLGPVLFIFGANNQKRMYIRIILQSFPLTMVLA